MRKLFAILILLSLSTIVMASNTPEDYLHNYVRVISFTEDTAGKTFHLQIDEPTWMEVGVNQDLHIAEYPGEGISDIQGEPVLPVLGDMVRMPITGGGHIEIIDYNYRVLNDIDYAAFSGDGLAHELENLDTSVDMWYPEEIITIENPAIFKDFRIANVFMFPIQVNPARRQVRVYDRLQYRIVYDDSNDENYLESWPTKLSETFLPFYRSFLDWNETELDQYELYRGGIQLVCKRDWLVDLHNWIVWKKQKGWEIDLLTDDDVVWSSDDIGTELFSRYQAAEIPFDHVVIIGDAQGIYATPPGSGFGSGAGDHVYGCLDGNDDLLDATVGRISVETANELRAYIGKVLYYEKSLNTSDAEWCARGSVAAGSAFSGISTVFTGRYARQVMLEAGYTQVDTAFYNDGLGNVNDRLINQINNGVGFHLYRGFAGSGISASQIEGLNNYFKLPVVVDITCGRGNWADSYSINEAYMRAGTVSMPRGGIGAISTATFGTHTRFNNALSGGAVEAVFVQKLPTLGQMLVGAKFNIWQNFNGFQNDGIDDFNLWLNLMGDPTVWIYTASPVQLTVDVDNEVNLGTRGIEVFVSDENGAVENAWVTFYKSDDNEEVISRTITDISGYAYLENLCQYSGTAVVTASAYNHKPKQENIQISTPEEHLGIVSFAILDDGSGETVGNGNGIAEEGETVGLTFRLKNYGQVDQTDITLVAASLDEHITSISGTATLQNLISGMEVDMPSPILVSISEDAPDDWTAIINLSISGSEGMYVDAIGLPVSAPKLIYSSTNGEVLPGQTNSVSFDIKNIGHVSSENVEVTLSVSEELSSWITINNVGGYLVPLMSLAVGSTSDFSITISPLAFKGFRANLNLQAEYPNGRIQNIPVQMQFGSKANTDPEGPDNYGYFAFENSDTSYIMSPEYNWLEINPNVEDAAYQGSNTGLSDGGYEQDESVVLDLPFNFTYYGETYSTITVCSNGWLAMGNQRGIALQRNWVIPSPLGPWAMIAPFWGDHLLRLESSGVYSHYIEEEGKYVIEWYDVTDTFSFNTTTFQVILLDNNDLPTPTGDNEFLFQYKTVNPTHGSSTDVPYSTIGIENETQQDGVMLSYYNVPSIGTSSIEGGRSILFSTRSTFTSGEVTGRVVSQSDQSPISGVSVSSSSLGTVDVTDADGNYTIHNAAGTCNIIFQKDGYLTLIEENVVVPEEGSVTVDVEMVRPIITISPESLVFNLDHGASETQTISMENSGDGVFTYDVEKWSRNPGTGGGNGVGEEIDFVMLPSIGTYTSFDIQNDTIFIVGTESTDLENKISLYDDNGLLIDSDRIPFSRNYKEIQVHGNIVVLGSDEELRFYSYDGGFSLDSTKIVQESNWPAKYGIDFLNGLIYQSGYSTLNKYNFEGDLIQQYEFTDSMIKGLDVLPEATDGFTVHMVIQQIEDGNYIEKVIRFNPETSESEVMFANQDAANSWSGGFALVRSSNGISNRTGMLMLTNPVGIKIYEYISNLEWIELDHTTGAINPGETENLNIGVNTLSLNPEGEYSAWINIRHNAAEGSIPIPLTVHVGESGFENSKEIPIEWHVEKIFPNPFNPVATAKFSLLEQVHVNAKLFNILGQQVAVLANRPMQAGTHSLSINGTNLSSGVYFLEFNAGPLSTVQKVVLMK